MKRVVPLFLVLVTVLIAGPAIAGMDVFTIDDYMKLEKLAADYRQAEGLEDRLKFKVEWIRDWKGKGVLIEGTVALVSTTKEEVDTDDGKKTLTKLNLFIKYFDFGCASDSTARGRKWNGTDPARIFEHTAPKSEFGEVKVGAKVLLRATVPATDTPSLDDLFESVVFKEIPGAKPPAEADS
ncbi:MAG: hypothetical protein ACYS8W_21605, partial [Planctomycetota bacterium]